MYLMSAGMRSLWFVHCSVLLCCGTRVYVPFSYFQQQGLGRWGDRGRNPGGGSVCTLPALSLLQSLLSGDSLENAQLDQHGHYSHSTLPSLPLSGFSVDVSNMPSLLSHCINHPFSFHGNLALEIQLWSGNIVNNYCSPLGVLHINRENESRKPLISN